MLSIETKKILNSARDVLVGKVPDPKAQVEQITFAMFYKFMDEKDKESIQLGGKAQFFVDEFENFSWSKLMDPRLGGIERMDLYTQALAKMSQNPHIAQLFRDIYKDAFIPFRSPETLNLFLKEIDKLDYSNTESLGDAFEYLLSIMGSQGDAGQFRTPRHIIDFIVDVVDPKKTDTILDPACGTAGFLISSYKHIIKQHDGKDDPEGKEKPLTPDEKKGLMKNLVGYDISPDMVRLSKVNMYLHGFPNPTIYEYDTLSSEEKWDENFDVVLANPPFMSPKGGIKPHKRFSIQANRSEVLFVDYIKEHLKPNGRAGIIVPEGIIFKNDIAYKKLRKSLIEDGLFAVVSLPAGVFNPYAIVKTSILFFDNSVAKKVKHIMFVKIHGDGFDLGVQRKASVFNDLPLALDALSLYKKHTESNGTYSIEGWPEGKYSIDTHPNCHFVSKEEIASDRGYSLSGDRYRRPQPKVSQNWQAMELQEVCEINPRKSQISPQSPETEVSFVPMVDLSENQMTFKPKQIRKLGEVSGSYTYFVDNDILLAKVTPCFENGKAGVASNLKNGIGFGSSEFIVLRPLKNILPELLYRFISSKDFREVGKTQMTGTGGLQRIPTDFVRKYKIPLPPIEVQRKIVEELNVYQGVIDGSKQVINSYKSNINYRDDWPKKKINQLAEINKDTKDPSKEFGEKMFTYIDISSVGNGTGEISFANSLRGVDAPSRARRVVHEGDVLISTVRPNLQAFAYVNNLPLNSLASTGFAVLTPKPDEIDGRYLFYAAGTATVVNQMISKMGRGAYPSINQDDIENIIIPTPPLDQQQKIAQQIEEERRIINENKKLIEIFEKKIEDKIYEIVK